VTKALTHWTEPKANLPSTVRAPSDIVTYAVQLSPKDQRQIVSAFTTESYEMAAGFVLKRTLSTLKRQLASLGMQFIGEMLGRTDIDDSSSPSTSISDVESISLARELGILTSVDAKRLSQHVELLAYFDEAAFDEDDAELDEDEARVTLRTCVQSVLGKERLDAPVEFQRFRQALEDRTLKADDHDLATLSASPYFFRKITVSVLLAGTRLKSGAKYEHVLGNIVVVIPSLWESLKEPERWSVGQAYAEAVNSANNPAAVALRKALSEVKGFDFVPETLRSQAFSAAAAQVLEAHNSYNNFYNEPPVMRSLAKLGSTIPWPAFPICLSATLAVRLGNRYGVSTSAQTHANVILERLTHNQWEYYLNNCLEADDVILQKLAWSDAPLTRWVELVQEFNLGDLDVRSADIRTLVAQTSARVRVKAVAEKLWKAERA
jgi:hypothetical protein